MTVGNVLGKLNVQEAFMGAEHLSWVQVSCKEGICAAVDLVGTQPGDLVLLCSGNAASRVISECPADAAVVAVLSAAEKEVDKLAQKRL